MSDHKIDFLSQERQDKPLWQEKEIPNQSYDSKQKRASLFNWKKIIISFSILIVIFLAVFSSSTVFSNNSLLKNLSKMNFLGQFGDLVTSQDRKLQGEDEDRINFLLIGMGGKNHEGGTLADTIIVASYQPSTKKLAMMSIPRDLRVKTANNGWVKINAVNAYAEKEEEGSGGQAMLDQLSKMLNLKIPYYVTVDFDGFEKLIDEFGGIDVVVDRDLIDYQYPIRGREYSFPISSRYEKLVIKKGAQHLDGATALKYARSRHALNGEGSDFARSQRQQKVISALKDKIFNVGTAINPKKINSLLQAYNDNIETNLQMWEMLRLAQTGSAIDTANIISLKVDDDPTSYLYSQMINGGYYLLPKDGTFDNLSRDWQYIFAAEKPTSTSKVYSAEYQEYYNNLKAGKKATTTTSSTPTKATTTASTTTPTIPPVTEVQASASIDVLNGTFITGWASQEKAKLITQGFKIGKTGNAPTRDYKNIIIYDLSGGNSADSLSQLQKLYSGATIAYKLPSGITSNADFVLILGK